jgi:hypothetical protein
MLCGERSEGQVQIGFFHRRLGIGAYGFNLFFLAWEKRKKEFELARFRRAFSSIR